MRKTWKRIGIAALVFSMSFLSGCSSNEEEKPNDNTGDTLQQVTLSESQKKLAVDFTKDFLDKDYDKILKDYAFDEQMKAEFEKEAFQKQLTDSLTAFGSLKQQEAPYGESYRGSVNISIPCVFEKQSFNIVLSLNAKDQIQGLFIKPYNEGPSSNSLPDGVKETTVDLKIDNSHTLPGTLTTPAQGENFPVVILVAGSGPNDRDETIKQNKPFQDIAWKLAEKGIASYRYDKRTYVYPKEFTLQDTVKQEVSDDVLLAIKTMEENKVIDNKQIYVLGHSLSGYLMPRIASQTTVPAGYILMAAPTRPLEDIFVEQIEFLAKEDGKVSEEEQKVIDKYKEDRDKVKQLDQMKDNEVVFGALSKAYMSDLKDYNPVDTAKNMDKLVMVAQGLRDYQVTQADYDAWFKAYGNADNWTFHTYPKANHIFMDGEGKASSADYDKKGEVNDDFIKDIVNFIKQ